MRAWSNPDYISGEQSCLEDAILLKDQILVTHCDEFSFAAIRRNPKTLTDSAKYFVYFWAKEE